MLLTSSTFRIVLQVAEFTEIFVHALTVYPITLLLTFYCFKNWHEISTLGIFKVMLDYQNIWKQFCGSDGKLCYKKSNIRKFRVQNCIITLYRNCFCLILNGSFHLYLKIMYLADQHIILPICSQCSLLIALKTSDQKFSDFFRGIKREYWEQMG